MDHGSVKDVMRREWRSIGMDKNLILMCVCDTEVELKAEGDYFWEAKCSHCDRKWSLVLINFSKYKEEEE